MGKSKSFDDYLNEKLKDPVYAEGYLKTAMVDEDPGVFTLALKQVARARGIGMGRLAKMTGLNRESLYKTLSERGNPALATVQKIASAIGFELGIRNVESAQQVNIINYNFTGDVTITSQAGGEAEIKQTDNAMAEYPRPKLRIVN